MSPLDLRHVHAGSEIGRRIDVTVGNNLLVLDADRNFLAPFRVRAKTSGCIGLGKLIDAAVRFAAYTGDPRVATLPAMVFYRAGDGLAVNLYTPAEALLTVAGECRWPSVREPTIPTRAGFD